MYQLRERDSRAADAIVQTLPLLLSFSRFKLCSFFFSWVILSLGLKRSKKVAQNQTVSSKIPASSPSPKEKVDETLPLANLDTQESKTKPRYAGHAGDQYILEEDDGHHGGQDEGEFIDEEAREEHAGQEQERGYHNDDKKVDDETKKDFKETGSFQDFSQDNDHFHDYDDKHEHQQMQGGRFSKGYKRTGENKEHDVGDEKHAWGKAGHDGQAEGFYEKGGHLSGQHHGHKKNEGHFDASSRHGKNSAYKLKKGEAPAVSSHYHQGGDHPQYYSQSDSGHGGHDHTLYRSQDIPEPHYEGHHSRHHRGNYNQAIIST
ncbi:uncharacterized protein TNIN_445901 [Trichonephila inaurata madagascariensis]|uniref:Uncharacterized protein n=1 Tax=Trichonephila inaurata madagascariensis TaxID=2747483 RepID=A0A8X6XIG5_9ARAC|nr:uncharacterized protein TNIN_445901 [Trichonephila inaurata madagascariensis]